MNTTVRRVNHTLGEIRKNLECSICLDLLKDPVSTKCDHQFCNFCILAMLDNRRRSPAPCPLCKEPVTKRSLTSNDHLNEIVRAVRGIVQAVEEDTGLKCTPPRGPRVLSQQSTPSPRSAENSEHHAANRATGDAANKKPTTSRSSKRANLRQAKPRSTGSIPVYIDGDDSDGSEASTEGVILITDFDRSRSERTSTRRGSKKTGNRRPLQQANQGAQLQQTGGSFAKPVLPSNKRSHQNGPLDDGPHLLRILDEASLGILNSDSPQGDQQGGESEGLPGVGRPPDEGLLQAFDRDSLGVAVGQDAETTPQEKSRGVRPPSQVSPEVHCPDSSVSFPSSDVDASHPKRIGNELMKAPAIGKGSFSSSAEDQGQDPYEFVPSQRTPRKPKPKRGRRQRNPSGKAGKEFDYMKWSAERKHPSGSQAFCSQSTTQNSASQGADNSPQAHNQGVFKRPSGKARHSEFDNEAVSPSNQVGAIELEVPARRDGEGTASLQGRMHSRQKKEVTAPEKVRCSEEAVKNEDKTTDSTVKASRSTTVKHDEAETAEVIPKPNTKRIQQSIRNGKPQELPTEPPTRTLRSRSTHKDTTKEVLPTRHSNPHKVLNVRTKQRESSPKDRKADKANGSRSLAAVEPDVSRKDKDARDESVDSQLSGMSSDEDGDYRFEDVSFHEDSDQDSTPPTITDPSYEPSTEGTEVNPVIFQDAEPLRRPTTHMELHFAKVPYPVQEGGAFEDKDEALEVMGCSQPVVKKHSPLSTSGAFGQVYRRGSRRIQNSLGGADLPKLGEKSQCLSGLKDEDVNDSLEEEHFVSCISETIGEDCSDQGEIVDPTKSCDSGHAASQERPSQPVVSQPDRADDQPVDLTGDSDMEDPQEVTIRDLQEVKQLPLGTDVAGRPPAETPQLDVVASKSDWELALELAREFDTEPRQFSLRSSRRGRKDPEAKDEAAQLGRAKPELDVSVQSIRGHEKSGSRGADIKECQTELQNRTITAGKRKLRQSQRSERSDARKEKDSSSKGKGKRRRRQSSGLPSTHHEVDGLDGNGKIESYDSNAEREQAKLGKIKPALSSLVEKSTDGEAKVLADPDLLPSKLTAQATAVPRNRNRNKMNESFPKAPETSQSSIWQSPTKDGVSDDKEGNTSSKRKTRQSSNNSNNIAGSITALNQRETSAIEVAGSGSKTRKTRLAAEKLKLKSLASPNKITEENSEMSAIGKDSSPTPEIASKQAVESASLFTEDFGQPVAEQQQVPGEGDSEHGGDTSGDTTESIDLSLEPNNIKGVLPESQDVVSHLSGSDTDSIELNQDSEDVGFIDPIPSPKRLRRSGASTTSGSRKSNRSPKGAIAEKGLKSTVHSPRSPSQKTSEGDASKMEVKREPAEMSRNTVPETVPSPATQASSRSTTLERSATNEFRGSALESPMITGSLQTSGQKQSRRHSSKRGLMASPGASSVKSFDDSSSNVESERMLIPPPSHYCKTFEKTSQESHPSPTGIRFSSKRKSCPEERRSHEMIPSNKRHRSGGAIDPEIQYWGMGSRRRSERLSRPAALEHGDSEDIPASLDSTGPISDGCLTAKSENDGAANIQIRRKSRNLSRSQKSLSGIKGTNSEQAVPATSPQQSKQFSQVSSQVISPTELSCHQVKDGTPTLLGSVPLFEEENPIHPSRSCPSQQLKKSQDSLPKSSSLKTDAEGSSSFFTPSEISPLGTEKSSVTHRNKQSVIKQDKWCTDKTCRTDSMQTILTPEGNANCDSTKSLSAEDSSEKYQTSSSLKSSEVSKASLSIPFQGKPKLVRPERVSQTHSRRSVKATKSPPEECVPASEGASVSPEDLSDPIIIARRRCHGRGDVNSSLLETPENSKKQSAPTHHTAAQGEKQASGSPRRKRFSFKRRGTRSQDTDASLSSQRESDAKVAAEGIQGVDHKDSSFGNNSSSARTPKCPSRRSQQVQQISSSNGLGPEISASLEPTGSHSKTRKRKTSMLAAGEAKQSRQDKILQDDNQSRSSGKASGENNQQLDSSGDVEMVSAEDDEPRFDDREDGKEDEGGHDDVTEGDVREETMDEQDEDENDSDCPLEDDQEDDDDDEDDVIIPPTPPCRLTTNFQTHTRPAYVTLLAASSASSNLSIQSNGSTTSRCPKNPAKSGSAQIGTVLSSLRTGGSRKTNLSVKESVLEKNRKAKCKNYAGNGRGNYHSESDDITGISFERRAFPLKSSPIEESTGETVDNSQSLSILQGFVQDDHSQVKSKKSPSRRPSSRSNKMELQDGEADLKTHRDSRGEKDNGEDFSNVSDKRHYDTEGSTCSESSSSHHLNLTSASSVLSSQSELMNTQQQLKAKESLQKMALEIAQMEAALADDTGTRKHPDATPANHPENDEEDTYLTHPNETRDKLGSPTPSSQHGDLVILEDPVSQDDPVSRDDPCPPTDDLCTPGDLFDSSDPCPHDADYTVPRDNCPKLESPLPTPDGITHPSKRSGINQRSSLLTSKRRPVISDDESESEEDFMDANKSSGGIEVHDDVDFVGGVSKTRSDVPGEITYISDSGKSTRKKPQREESLVSPSPPSMSQSTAMMSSSPVTILEATLIGNLSKSALEIPGVTTYGSDSDLSEPEDPDVPSGSPRSPSPPPELSQLSTGRASLLASLPESVQAVSRLVEDIRSVRRSSSAEKVADISKSGSGVGGSSKRRMEIPSELDSDEEEYRALSPKRRSRHVLRATSRQTTLRQTSSWKSKRLEMLSDSRFKSKPGNATLNSGGKVLTTPARESRRPTKAEPHRGKPLRQSKLRDGTPRDESPEERSSSPVIGRSLLTTPVAKKKVKPASFVTTGLNRTDMRDVDQLTKRFGCRFASIFNACTTHVIVNTDNDFVCERTLKYFQGIAARVWVVSFKWVTACLKTEQLLPEEPFEVQGDVVNGSAHYGPRRARICRGPYPLHRYDVCCVGPFTGLNKEQLVSLLELMGAVTVQHPSLFPYSAGRHAVIIAQAEATDSQHDYDALYKKYRVPVISREWVLDIIATYKIQPMTDYLLSMSASSQPIIDLDSDDN